MGRGWDKVSDGEHRQPEGKGLDRLLTFGKYKGASFRQVADRDPDYGWWLVTTPGLEPLVPEEIADELAEYLRGEEDPLEGDGLDWRDFGDL